VRLVGFTIGISSICVATESNYRSLDPCVVLVVMFRPFACCVTFCYEHQGEPSSCCVDVPSLLVRCLSRRHRCSVNSPLYCSRFVCRSLGYRYAYPDICRFVFPCATDTHYDGCPPFRSGTFYCSVHRWRPIDVFLIS
jgi:hypothetical protein